MPSCDDLSALQWIEKRRKEAKLEEQRKEKLDTEARIKQKAEERAKLDARRKAKLDQETRAEMSLVSRNPKKVSMAHKAASVQPNLQADELEIMGHTTLNLVSSK